jgi:hypothetical protein
MLMFSRLAVANVELANAHHVIGSLVLTVVSIAAAEVARKVRYLIGALGAALAVVPFVFYDDMIPAVVSVALGIGLIGLCIRRGPVRERYGTWQSMTY